jgi:hypothetical protein
VKNSDPFEKILNAMNKREMKDMVEDLKKEKKSLLKELNNSEKSVI